MGRRSHAELMLESVDRTDKDSFRLVELPGLFARMKKRALASQWPSLIIDAAICFPDEFCLGNLARCFIAVNQQLHGVKYETPVIGVPVVKHEPRPMSLEQKSSENIVSQGDGFTVRKDPPPIPKRGSRGGIDALNHAILKLKPGEHIRIESGKMKRATVYSRVNMLRKKHGLGKDVRSYEAMNGDFVVHRAPADK